MDIRYSTTLAASTDQVFHLLIQHDFQAEKARRLESLHFDMDTTIDDTQARVITRRRVATEGLPEFVKSLLTPTMTVTETEAWESVPVGHAPTTGVFTLDVDGAPVELRGRVDLTPHDSTSSTLTFSGTLSATIPLFRARIEEASSGAIYETMRTEGELLRETLLAQACPAAT